MTAAPPPRVILLSQGDEVLTGQTVDTNAAWLAARLDQLGFDLIRHFTVGDHLSVLVDALTDIARHADVCICTGGLGPTQDDLTAQAVSEAFSKPLALDAAALNAMESFFAKRGIPMPAVNRKQALLPQGAERLDNAWGTAPGFCLQTERCRFYFVPGVPYEMRQIFEHTIEPQLRQAYALTPPRRVILRTLGIGESRMQELLDEVAMPDEVVVSFRAGLPENELKLRFPPDHPDQALRRCVEVVQSALGDAVYAVDGLDESVSDLYQWVDQRMRRLGLQLAVVETLTQGLVASHCHPDWLLQAQVFPNSSDALSQFDLGRSGSAPAKQLAGQLAGRVKTWTSAPIALVQVYSEPEATGSAGEGVTAVASSKGISVVTHPLHGRFERRRIMATAHAFDTLRKFLLTLAEP